MEEITDLTGLGAPCFKGAEIEGLLSMTRTKTSYPLNIPVLFGVGHCENVLYVFIYITLRYTNITIENDHL